MGSQIPAPDRLDRCDERLGLHRFLHHDRSIGGERALGFFVQLRSRTKYHWNLVVRLLNAFLQRKTIDVRHRHIENQAIGRL